MVLTVRALANEPHRVSGDLDRRPPALCDFVLGSGESIATKSSDGSGRASLSKENL